MFHPFHLAEQMQSEDATVVALLHDVLEDTDHDLSDLSQMDLEETVIAVLVLLTHDNTVEYMDYIRAIKENPVAKAVKLADLRHNFDLSRLDEINENVLKRRDKYLRAMAILKE